MKAFFAILFSVSIAHASTGNVLLTCTETGFSDLTKIEVIEGTVPDDVLIVETNDQNVRTYYTLDKSTFLLGEVPLSRSKEFMRRLVKYNGHYVIEFQGDCGGGMTSAICQ